MLIEFLGRDVGISSSLAERLSFLATIWLFPHVMYTGSPCIIQKACPTSDLGNVKPVHAVGALSCLGLGAFLWTTSRMPTP